MTTRRVHMPLTGTCLCGAVQYEASTEPLFSSHCYCADCQKETGGGHLTIAAVPDASVKISGATSTFTKLGGSGQPTERTFCPKCGSTIFSRPRAMAGVTMLRAGTLNNPSRIAPSMSIYTSRAQPWDQPSASIPGFLELPSRPKEI
jgi:hypothetical protein